MNFYNVVNYLLEASQELDPFIRQSRRIQSPKELVSSRKKKVGDDENFQRLEDDKKSILASYEEIKTLANKKPTPETSDEYNKKFYSLFQTAVNSLTDLSKFENTNEKTAIGEFLTLREILEILKETIEDGFKKKILKQGTTTNWKAPFDSIQQIYRNLKLSSPTEDIAKAKELKATPRQVRRSRFYYALDKRSTPNNWILYGIRKGDKIYPREYTVVESEGEKYTANSVLADPSIKELPLLFVDGKPTYGKDLKDLEANYESLPEGWEPPLLRKQPVEVFIKRIGSDIIEKNLDKIKHPFVTIEEAEMLRSARRKVDTTKEKRFLKNPRPTSKVDRKSAEDRLNAFLGKK